MTPLQHPNSPAPERVSVVVVGAGPAGLTVGNILRRAGVDCVVLETETREFIQGRQRAGVIEEWAVRALQERGLAGNLLSRAERHTACEFRFEGRRQRFSYGELTGRHHFIYPQPMLVTDLLREYTDVRGGTVRFDVRDVRVHDVDTDRPSVSYLCPRSGRREVVHCDFIAGCDGARGVTRKALAAGRTARHDYGIGWLSLLAEAPPSSDCVLFGIHQDGFAGQMPRSPEVTRYYLQCPPGDDPENWPHDRVWAELRRRLAADGAPEPVEGRLIEKRVLDMHDYVVEPMASGRLFLAGDAAHLVAPIAAKGMNLALHDAFLLGDALVARLQREDGDDSALAGYSEACLRRVWDYQEFSQWLSEVYHGPAAGEPFRTGTALARLRRLFASPVAAAAFAEQYLGTAERY
ncbi:4-hydroxybenzoate 3-monooxygenase [Streptomyces antnestii]|uniref:4-hydroxybenzoate 3-monooxygenase n=1 Tax=Streptomyces antnestii TaxID=2494256 RepID=A0A3S2W4U2_9ACTN|nr:4-hydroxybenzoate 3-monooxygenase [Streptomyces sp. San01]RVU27947.1 4-hydroxybenzoate 3-monooxygenase [Streptomyces sp. San01]